MRQAAKRLIPLVLLALAAGNAGCRSLRPCSLQVECDAGPLEHETALEAAYAELARAAALEEAGDPRCVDAYYRAARLAWLSTGLSGSRRCYNDATCGLIFAAQGFGRLDPARGLVIQDAGQEIVIPVAHYGFVWNAADFQCLQPPPTGHEPLLARRFRCQGWGVPLVIVRRRCADDPFEARFLPEESFFAATAVMRFEATVSVLEFHNPHNTKHLATEAGELPLAADLSAPLAATLEVAPRTYLAGFIEPGRAATTTSRLTILEPYQRGKFPILLVHGLFSDPLSWADLVNDLRAVPGFTDHFQIWVFRYPTGQGFLQSAAALRGELQAAVGALDPAGEDAALRRMVLIGHSMGGLVAKLQVTYSDELIWRKLANVPLDVIATKESTRALLAETCYFDPSPHVARVVFIASPHCGSLHSSELIGRGAAHFVEPSPQQAAIHEQLVRDNPGVFNPEFERRFPTSIDMLAPDSPLLHAMRQMRVGAHVQLHNIVGVSCPLSLDGPSDGVVSVRSASHPGCLSVRALGASHVKIHRSIETSREVLRILDCHLTGAAISRRALAPAAAPRGF